MFLEKKIKPTIDNSAEEIATDGALSNKMSEEKSKVIL